jgi:hypothetical protein
MCMSTEHQTRQLASFPSIKPNVLAREAISADIWTGEDGEGTMRSDCSSGLTFPEGQCGLPPSVARRRGSFLQRSHTPLIRPHDAWMRGAPHNGFSLLIRLDEFAQLTANSGPPWPTARFQSRLGFTGWLKQLAAVVATSRTISSGILTGSVALGSVWYHRHTEERLCLKLGMLSAG